RQGLVEPGFGCGHVDLLQSLFLYSPRGIGAGDSHADTHCSGNRFLPGLGKLPMVSVLSCNGANSIMPNIDI
ncbi:hypothetical protein, partial [Achromobacter spanius]|uniref:hypothetical protein n=1 Tax=Achromobacter spanius TaxID=217203 RepID=UPI003F68CBEE